MVTGNLIKWASCYFRVQFLTASKISGVMALVLTNSLAKHDWVVLIGFCVWSMWFNKYSCSLCPFNCCCNAFFQTRWLSHFPTSADFDLMLLYCFSDTVVLHVKLSANLQVARTVRPCHASECSWTGRAISWGSLQQKLHSTETWSWAE